MLATSNRNTYLAVGHGHTAFAQPGFPRLSRAVYNLILILILKPERTHPCSLPIGTATCRGNLFVTRQTCRRSILWKSGRSSSPRLFVPIGCLEYPTWLWSVSPNRKRTLSFFFFFTLCTLPQLFLFLCGIFAVGLSGMSSVVFCLFDMVSCSWDVHTLWGPFNTIATPFLERPQVTSFIS
jgi:hypothetical protein